MISPFSNFKKLPLALLLLELLAGTDAASKCTGNINTRKEIRKLSTSELNTMISAYTKMYNVGWYDWYSFVHLYYAGPIHGNSQFLPWHRQFTRDYEKTAMHYEPSFSLPYWDASIDYSKPASSIVFTSNYLGGNGAGSNSCVGTGFARTWTRMWPNSNCLQRSFDRGSSISSWDSPESVTSMLQTTTGDYDSFRGKLEYGIHGSVHIGIGGDMSTMQSPADPFFFLHHSNIDRLWWKWQNMAPSNMNAYSGSNSSGRQASTSDQIATYNIAVSEVMQLGYGDMCFQYDDTQALNKRAFDSEPSSSKRNDVPAHGAMEMKMPLGSRRLIKNTESIFKVRADAQQNLVTSTDSIQNVTSVPQMSLVTAIDSSILSKFFPLIVSNDLNQNALALPDVVTVKANQFASEYLTNATNADDGNSNIVVPPADQQPVTSDSITDSLIKSTNKVSNDPSSGINSPVSSNNRSSRKNRSLDTGTTSGTFRTGGFDPTPKTLMMPSPLRLPDSYIQMMGYNMDDYNKYYNEKIDMVNALNGAGYVSPYI